MASSNKEPRKYQSEYRNEIITGMSPAQGWWKITVYEDGNTIIEPVAFFATASYETRCILRDGEKVYDTWSKEYITFAHDGIGDDWFMGVVEAPTNTNLSRLFYDPDFRLPIGLQFAGDDWVTEQKEYYASKK